MNTTLKIILGNLVRLGVYILAGFGLYAFINNPWLVGASLAVCGVVEGFTLHKR